MNNGTQQHEIHREKSIKFLDFAHLKDIASLEILEKINSCTRELDFEILILNFSARLTTPMNLANSILTSPNLQMIAIGNPPMSIVISCAAWKTLGGLDTSLPLPAALQKLCSDGLRLRKFTIITLPPRISA